MTTSCPANYDVKSCQSGRKRRERYVKTCQVRREDHETDQAGHADIGRPGRTDAKPSGSRGAGGRACGRGRFGARPVCTHRRRSLANGRPACPHLAPAEACDLSQRQAACETIRHRAAGRRPAAHQRLRHLRLRDGLQPHVRRCAAVLARPRDHGRSGRSSDQFPDRRPDRDPAQPRTRHARRSAAVCGGVLAKLDDVAVQPRAGGALPDQANDVPVSTTGSTGATTSASSTAPSTSAPTAWSGISRPTCSIGPARTRTRSPRKSVSSFATPS